jgi:signal transduction histidine kinase
LPNVRWLSGLLVSVTMVAAMSGLVALLHTHFHALNLLVLYLLVVMPVAIVWGTGLAAVTSVLSAAVYAFFFLSPSHSFQISDTPSIIALGVFLVTAIVVGNLTARLRRAALESERLSAEQSALRRVATLVARSALPPSVFEAVTREVGRLCGADLARMEHYEEDGTVTGVAIWSRSSVPAQLAVGTRFGLEGPSVAREVRRTGGPVRIRSFAGASGAIAAEARELGIRSSVGCPIVVAGHLWGVIAASKRSDDPFPPNTESQLGSFTELIATAIANAESGAQLAASRARVVAAGDETRRRLERDLHDGAQQRLVSLVLGLRLVRGTVPAELPALRDDIGKVTEELTQVMEELRELSRGIHPAILSDSGLGPALRTLIRRSAISVELHVDSGPRYPPSVEVAAYYVVSEALTNVTKYASTSHAEVAVEERDSTLRVCVRDNGVGGAEPQRGSGLIGLRDRVEALGGSIDVTSPVGQGTVIDVLLPIERTGGGVRQGVSEDGPARFVFGDRPPGSR